MRTTKKVLTLTALAVALQACGGGDVGKKLTPAAPVTESTAVFNPALGGDGLPFPADLLFASTADGSINIPGKLSSFDPTDAAGTLGSATATPVAAALADPQTALNTMDGFSTTAPMVVRFSDAISSSSTGLQENIRVFQLDSFDPSASGALAFDGSKEELIWGVDFVAGVSGGTTLLIQPLRPLSPSTTYIVVVEDGLQTSGGGTVSADDTYSLLNGSYQLTPALGGTGGVADFVLELDGDPCDFVNAPGDCLDVNTEDYTAAAVVPGAESAAVIAGNLAALETAGSYSTLFQLEQLRRITAAHLTLLETATSPLDASEVLLSYSVSTQDVGTALSLAAQKVDGDIPYDFPPVTSAAAPDITVLNPIVAWPGSEAIRVTSPGPDGDLATPDYLAHIYVGTLDNMLQFVDPASPNSSVWEAVKNPANWGGVLPCTALPAAATGSENLVGCNGYNPTPVVTDHSVPVIISAPRSESLAGAMGYVDCSGGDLPVVIYQHGITTSRATLLAIADTLASRCIVGVAIDMPKHGILPENDPFGASDLATLQRTLDPSVFERLVKVANPMDECQAGVGVSTVVDTDYYCPSGDNYVNLANLANARDTVRQSVVDLHSLYRAIAENGGTDLVASTIGTTVDSGNIHFAGVSLGGIVGATFAAQDPGLGTVTLNVSGAGIAKILDGSPSFEPQITAGLYETGGISKPGGDYEGFLIIAQTMVDNTDPVNFADTLAGLASPVLMQEVVGDLSQTTACLIDGEPCPDQVVPNNVFGKSFGPAWGLVSQSGQDNYLPNQNFVTTPVALAGTDAFAQGTGFVALAAIAQANAAAAPTVIGLGPIGVSCSGMGDPFCATTLTYKGLGLSSVGSCGTAAGGGIVRFSAGDHGSMLSPTASPAVTYVMQRQMADFVLSSAVANDDVDTNADGIPDTSSGVVFDTAAPSASHAACP